MTEPYKPKVLAIDDEATCLEIIKFSLSTKGYEVFTAESGAEAIEFLQQHSDINVVLLDMMMPKMNGLETLKKIRQISSASNIPIIFQTGTSHYAEINKAQEEDVNNFIIHKPYKRADLIKVIDIALKNT